MRTYRHWLAILCLVWAGACSAQNWVPGSLLGSGNFKPVEDWLRSIDASFVRGEISEYGALDAYRPFYQSEDVLSDQLNDWVRQRPDSDIAYLARGTYRRKLGEFRRGTDDAAHVPAASMQYMQAQFEAASKDFAQALKINPRSYLAMLNQMNIAMYEADEPTARAVLATANQAYPRNLLVRARYMVHLAPRWGGTYARMDDFIAQTRAAGAPPQVVNLLAAIKMDDVGFSSAEAGDREAADRSYDEALVLARGADLRFVSSYLAHAAARCLDTCGH